MHPVPLYTDITGTGTVLAMKGQKGKNMVEGNATDTAGWMIGVMGLEIDGPYPALLKTRKAVGRAVATGLLP